MALYFLLVKEISKLLLILYEMIMSTLSFMLVFLCYLVVFGSVFCVLFQDVLPENYGSILLAVRTLFDAGLAVYSQAVPGK